MRSPRTPNQALRALLAEAGWSGAQLAREVNALSLAQGTVLRYDRTTVAHWLAGSRPRLPVPSLVAEALSRRLGRSVRTQDTGLIDGVDAGLTPGAPVSEGSGVDRLDHLLHTTGRCGIAMAGAYSLAALAIPPGRVPAGGTPDPTLRSPASATRAQVESARELLAVFSCSDAAFGAGSILRPLRQYLSATLLPWLRGDMKPAVRRDLFTVAAQLTYLCAFAHFDMNRHAEAQHFYLASIELAREAGDRVGYALGLRGLSVQAHALRHFPEAHRLAEQAVTVGLRHTPPHQQAFLLGQLGVAQAGHGDTGHTRSLAAAERCLERSSSGTSPVGAFHPGSLALQHAAVAKSRGDHRAVVGALGVSLRLRPAGEHRSRALGLAELAEAQLTAGHLEQACVTWHGFLELYPQIHSDRADERLRALAARLRPHAATPAAAALIRRAHEVRRRPSATV
ncbi:hypothetical protein QQM39_00455 [Streptomyces sp. DT2A-34]|uniref:hypothetical protein n=1 Tax=Streptomyces sp. DT2A-34 TaxID=3051182 RepID=UPI00265C5125|nr:hypothetical protein [Streptomyces sp. DT2A-34]MDO0909386.1 hypothetical protein [Streptomyces sp. DT2A-34]